MPIKLFFYIVFQIERLQKEIEATNNELVKAEDNFESIKIEAEERKKLMESNVIFVIY